MNGLGITDPLAQQAAAQGSAQSTAPGGALGKEEFLHLLVTQLKNQDPLSPMDGQEFAAQLAQFTSVEQLVNISDVLAQSINSGVAAGLIGKSIEASGNGITWNGEDAAEMKFELASGAADVKVTVRNAAGIVVRAYELGGRGTGEHTIDWDGMTGTNAAAAKGSYTFDISATDAQGKPVESRTFTRGTVDRITFGQDGVRLWLGAHSVAMSEVSSVE